MLSAEDLSGGEAATRSSRDGRPGSVPAAHHCAGQGLAGFEMDEQECSAGHGPEQFAGAVQTQGDWEAWTSTSGRAAPHQGLGGEDRRAPRRRR